MSGVGTSATELVFTSSYRTPLKADAGERRRDDDEEEDGLFGSMLATMYVTHGFRVVCEVP